MTTAMTATNGLGWLWGSEEPLTPAQERVRTNTYVTRINYLTARLEEVEQQRFHARDELVDRHKAEHRVRQILAEETFSLNPFKARYAKKMLTRVDAALRGIPNTHG